MIMSRLRERYGMGSIVLCLMLSSAGCVSIPRSTAVDSSAEAMRILNRSAEAHGVAALQKRHDVNVRFEGKWEPLIGRIQPALVDDRFRGTSEERYLIHEAAVGQRHEGPGGLKQVFRYGSGVKVWYNGKATDDEFAVHAAALVADAYRMFLFGPQFFLERSAAVQYLGVDAVDGRECDQLLAVLRPGIGLSVEDRVIISIDRKQCWVRRVRMTVDGLASTRGAIVDVFLRDHARIGGVVWPTSFYETLKRPFPLPVHRWRLTGIDFDRNYAAETIQGPKFTGAAVRAAGTDASGE